MIDTKQYYKMNDQLLNTYIRKGEKFIQKELLLISKLLEQTHTVNYN